MSTPVSIENIDDRVVMYILVNQDLKKMQKGKICSQVGHACAVMTRTMEYYNPESYKKWLRTGETKIVLKCKQNIMEKLADKYRSNNTLRIFPIYDVGKSQCEEGSFTVLAFQPLFSKNVPGQLQYLKLL